MAASRDDVRDLADAVVMLVEGAYRGMARTYDVTRVGLLRLSAEGAAVRPSDVAAALDVNPSTVTRYVRSLEQEGLVTVTGDPHDGRSCRIAATDRGLAELARFEEAGLEVFASVIRDWSVDDVQQMTRLVNKLAANWAARGPAQTRPPRRPGRPRWRATRGGSAG